MVMAPGCSFKAPGVSTLEMPLPSVTAQGFLQHILESRLIQNHMMCQSAIVVRKHVSGN
ncbi:hypothetical protein FOPG_17901 [Fusarium oxysporum f. sp. conglutinans race 2 54008]|uniref:Uncharacterized protein n=1 Tax=Fusarium oxysporum f. sp. conglutinans race 2 54008 TaxID=1089457 RepID=X0H1E8_FUSOX|nr:hypothetical protein FOPG_17901 [Fusarium oxysporum f. sp. conglutinans race 2 54008]